MKGFTRFLKDTGITSWWFQTIPVLGLIALITSSCMATTRGPMLAVIVSSTETEQVSQTVIQDTEVNHLQCKLSEDGSNTGGNIRVFSCSGAQAGKMQQSNSLISLIEGVLSFVLKILI